VWLKAVAVLLVILIVVAMFRLPSELGAAVAIRHGDEAEAKGDHSAALAFYQKALATYPNSEDALCGAAVSAIRSGNKEAAVDYLRRFAAKGDSVSKTNVARLNAALGDKS
jgi:Flp pilus assembly protein TadD